MEGAPFPSRWSPGVLNGPHACTSKPGAFPPRSGRAESGRATEPAALLPLGPAGAQLPTASGPGPPGCEFARLYEEMMDFGGLESALPKALHQRVGN